ncbi:hypothetical protein NM688_g737 [Phlebia brevispora]|uniref:Uncharacterized protein n=1 Tax=Phlebia brevispora TaxID=194682 RepID=A0ACC1TD63_9APHY|nr:hypothetical protein NM688_g737 [Phlebia brevispora]
MSAVLQLTSQDGSAGLSSVLGSSSLGETSSFVGTQQAKEESILPTRYLPTLPTQVTADAEEPPSSDDEYESPQTTEDTFGQITLEPGGSRFFGKSSSVVFMRKAMEICQEYANEGSSSGQVRTAQHNRRPEIWQTHPWLKTLTPKNHFSFPPEDLMPSLINWYFAAYNAYSPLLHRPTFDDNIRNGLHLRNDSFASVVLLVCALGSRLSNDPRILLDGYDDIHSAGWKWFNQAKSAFQIITFGTPSLFDIQTVCLSMFFLTGSSEPASAWPLIGVGLRLAVALGAHRRKTYASPLTLESELLKRAFWILNLMDRAVGSSFGLPCGIQDEDYDVDLPSECDDEYWVKTGSSTTPHQPDDVPSKISFFNCSIRLSEIHAYALRTIYSINKSKVNLGRAKPGWEEQAVTELDSALNHFMDSIPEHLRWGAAQTDLLLLNQSALIYSQYCSVQISVHRSFIPSPGKPARFKFPSLAICTNAARSCIRVSDVLQERVRKELHPTERCYHVDFTTLFMSSIILLLNIWANKRSESTAGYAEDMSNVRAAMHMIKDSERRCFSAGRFWDVLNEMITIGEPFDQQNVDPTGSRNESAEGNPFMSHLTTVDFASPDVFASFIFPPNDHPTQFPLYPTEASSGPPLGSSYPNPLGMPGSTTQSFAPIYDPSSPPASNTRYTHTESISAPEVVDHRFVIPRENHIPSSVNSPYGQDEMDTLIYLRRSIGQREPEPGLIWKRSQHFLIAFIISLAPALYPPLKIVSMSSQDEATDVNRNEKPLKKKRGRACDACRQKKVRCDGVPGRRCANCTTGGFECTYVGAAKKRYPDVAYMEQLETEVENMRKLLNKLHPGADFSSELNGVVSDNSLWRVEPMTTSALPWTHQSPTPSFPPSPIPPLSEYTRPGQADPDMDSSDDEVAAQHVFRRRSELWRMRTGSRPRFLGKSSRFMFLQKALDYRHQYAGTNGFGDEPWRPRPRAEYWKTQEWLAPSLFPESPYPSENFPPSDLMWDCIGHYFDQYNICVPLLHRPTFEEHVKSGLHLIDDAFGSTVLLVCAIGSRFSEDIRVLSEDELAPEGEEQRSWQSAGWKWFAQVQTSRKALALSPPRLFDLQVYALAATYLYGSSISQPAWPSVGIGLRFAQDLGAHRKKTYQQTPNVEEEQLKRAFWVLLTIDRSLSSGLGRPCCLQDEDFDVDLPIECDDEYWVNPNPALAFKQPPGKPSVVAFFNSIIRLKQIHAHALRTLSAILYSAYYALQINVHRPYIPSPRKPSKLSFPSLAICTNAARSAIHVLDVHYSRSRGKIIYQGQAILFTAGVVLLLNIWGGKLSGASPNPVKEMAEVHKAMKMLKAQEPRWFSAGRYWDVLYDLASVGDLPLPQPAVVSHKRPRQDSLSQTTNSTPQSVDSPPVAEDGVRPVAGSKRVQAYQQSHAAATSSQSSNSVTNDNFFLPVHTADLGRLPLHSVLAPAPDFGGTGWYPSPSSSIPLQAQVPAVTAADNSALDSVFTQAFNPVPHGGVLTTDVLQHPASATQTQFPPMLPDVPQTGIPDGSIEDMMASITMDPHSSQLPDFPENDTLDMWSNAPTNFEWGDWGSFISTFGFGEPPADT